jgi:hypothetical protein
MAGLAEADAERVRAAILRWGEALPAWDVKWRTGIYPGEMAAFLGMCDAYGIRAIVESGRAEGYSTQVLGEYADRTETRVVSIDWDRDSAQARECLERLACYRRLECRVGDALKLIPAVARGLPAPIALLLDGPKEHQANRVSLVAAVMFPIKVVAHHNSELVTPWGREFAALFPGAFHYEGLDLDARPEWRAFKAWERAWVGGYELPGVPGRSLSASSLALAVTGPRDRALRRLLALGGLTGFRRADHPVRLWARWMWRRGRGAGRRVGSE